MRKLVVLAALFAALTFTLTACSGGSDSSKPAEPAKPAETAAMPPMTSPHGPGGPGGEMAKMGGTPDTGMITEAMDADAQTYVHLDVGGGKSIWVVAPQTMVNVGEVVTVKNPVAKNGYRSAELKRDFDVIYSVSAIMPMAQNQPHPKTPIANVEVKNVAKLSGGYTVSELYSKKDQLADKEVTLRAKVVKFTGGIMGTNWMHLRDGSGDDKTNDLTITSASPAKAGDMVVVKGVLKKDVDIGSGYFFPLIIQNANVKVE